MSIALWVFFAGSLRPVCDSDAGDGTQRFEAMNR
jgi:hypothetical protein